MFLSMNWISDFVDLKGIDLVELIHRFSLSTAEVENEIFFKGSDISGIIVAQIKSVENHPESKKLHLLKVDTGDKIVDVVCGAPNVRVGMKTAFAKLGAKIGDITIEPRKLAGYTSNGMCCSEKELGISDDHSGIMEIFEDVKNGTDIKSLYEIDDIIFEVDNKSLTNRPDLWGHYGIAREFAALADRPLKPLPVVDLEQYANLPKVDLEILDPLCQRYSCLQVENVTKNVSPVNMRIRLYYCGMRAINLLADLTNYLMLEMGQPMHAFDSRKVEKIRVRRFDEPFTFKTLDGVERNCDENTLMICNDKTPVAIAGIMGGYDSEIVDDTTTLTLESATFDAVSIRKSTVRLAHRTDASMRYEKCLDPELTVVAIARFIKLLSEIDSGIKVVSSLTDEYKFRYKTVNLNFDKKYVDRYTGINISNDTIVKTLKSLGFEVSLKDDNFSVTVPSWRATKDVTIKADIIEEITRIYGYDNFEVNTTLSPLRPVRESVEKSDEDRIKDILVQKFNLHELHSYLWQSKDELKEIGIEVEDNVKILNATNPNIETIRRSIVPTELCQIKQNSNFANEFGIFEIGRVVDGLTPTGECNEKKMLCITLSSKQKTQEKLYFEMRNILYTLVNNLKHKEIELKPANSKYNYEHPKNYATVIADGNNIGYITLIHPLVSNSIDKKSALVCAEIDMKCLAQVTLGSIEYEEPSKFPEIDIDLSFVTDTYEPIKNAVLQVNSPLVKKISVTDIYKDEKSKSITVRITFAHKDRTLTMEEVQAVANEIIEILKTKSISLKD